MNKLLEFNVVSILQDNKQAEKFMSMGIDIPENIIEERLVKYSFDASNITEMRQTFVKYKGEHIDATVCAFGEDSIETPPLLVHYDKLKEILNEYNKKNTETQEGGVL